MEIAAGAGAPRRGGSRCPAGTRRRRGRRRPGRGRRPRAGPVVLRPLDDARDLERGSRVRMWAIRPSTATRWPSRHADVVLLARRRAGEVVGDDRWTRRPVWSSAASRRGRGSVSCGVVVMSPLCRLNPTSTVSFPDTIVGCAPTDSPAALPAAPPGRLTPPARRAPRGLRADRAARHGGAVRGGRPVYTEQGRGGGCVLLEGWETDVSGLSPTRPRPSSRGRRRARPPTSASGRSWPPR